MKKKISEQSELCSDMVAEMKRFELLRRGTPDLPHFEILFEPTKNGQFQAV